MNIIWCWNLHCGARWCTFFFFSPFMTETSSPILLCLLQTSAHMYSRPTSLFCSREGHGKIGKVVGLGLAGIRKVWASAHACYCPRVSPSFSSLMAQNLFLSTQARGLPYLHRHQAPFPSTSSLLPGFPRLSFICKAASHTLCSKLPLSFLTLAGCLRLSSHTQSNPICVGCKLFT